MYIYIYVFMYVYIYIYVCTHVFANTEITHTINIVVWLL